MTIYSPTCGLDICNLVPLLVIVFVLAGVIMILMQFSDDDPMEHVYYLEEIKK